MAVALGTSSGFCLAAPSSDPGGTSDQVIDRSSRAQRDTSPGAGYAVSSVMWWCDNATEEANFEVAIMSHDSDNNLPNAILASNVTNAKGTDGGWKSATLSWTCEAGTFWVAVQLDNTATSTNTDREGVAGARVAVNSNTTSLDTTSWVGAGADNRIYSICAVYSASGISVPVAMHHYMNNLGR